MNFSITRTLSAGWLAVRLVTLSWSGYSNNDIIIWQHVCGYVLCYTSRLKSLSQHAWLYVASGSSGSATASSLFPIRSAELGPRGRSSGLMTVHCYAVSWPGRQHTASTIKCI